VKSIVIIPTYNEKENIQHMLPELMKLNKDLHVLVVDDNSPDGTGQIVESLAANEPRLHLLNRPGKGGLGRAYIAGFKWAIENQFDYICQMDADFSHRLEDLGKMLQRRGEADVMVGSRWVKGGGTINWSWLRRFISKGGSFYSRQILGYKLRDWTGGFNMWKADVLKAIQLDRIASEGYSFQIEMKFRAKKKGFSVEEMPILFEERRAGQSKMSLKIVLEALYRVWSIRFAS